jgi:hypothetical protein
MPIGASDINYVYSGGPANINPNLSLGGAPSVHTISGKNLFDNISDEQSVNGTTDYRCFYINNDSFTETLYNSEIFVNYKLNNETIIELGFESQNDRQYVNITNFSNITGGSFILTYNDTLVHNFTVNYDANVATFVSNFQTAITAIAFLEDVTVNGSYNVASDTLVFEINFIGESGNRYHEAINLNSNNLTYSGNSPTISIIKSVNGSPINKEADSIDVETTPPANITFSSNPYNLGSFRYLDVVPVWIKRIVPANTVAIQIDSFILRIRGDSVPS